MFHIPTIDVSPFIRDPDTEESDAVVEQVRSACRTSGFFQITGHGIPPHLQKAAFEAAARFFKLPFDVKKSLDANSTVGRRGYDVLAAQSFSKDVAPDLKEGFYFGQDVQKDDPLYGRFLMGLNVWPSPDLLPEEDFREHCETYYGRVYTLCLTVLDIVARALPYGPNIFANFTAGKAAAPLRLLHYPPASRTQNGQQFGASPHTDFGAVTLLLQDENPGLEVYDSASETWREVPPNPEAYVVNIGDMLSMWTNGEYKSSIHRVINKNPTDRYSLAFFFDGHVDCHLNPLDGSPGAGLTVEDHLRERFATTYRHKTD